MSRTVVLVHPDNMTGAAIAEMLRGRNYRVCTFSDPLDALSHLEVTPADALVTTVRFGTGRLHGIALSIMAGVRHPGLKALLLTEPQDRKHAEPFGEYLAAPSDPLSVVDALDRLLELGVALV